VAKKKPERFTPSWTFHLAKQHGIWFITDFS